MAPDVDEQKAEVNALFDEHVAARNQKYAEELQRLEEAHKADVEALELSRAAALGDFDLQPPEEEED